MEWLGENWILLLLIGGMFGMHFFMHRGHGGHGGKEGHGAHGGDGGNAAAGGGGCCGGRKSKPAPQDTATAPKGELAPPRD